MNGQRVWRRQGRAIALAALGIVSPAASAAELEVPATAVTVRYDLEDGRLGDWKTIDGRWAIEAMAGAPSGRRVLVQRAVENVFNVIVAPVGPYADVDASVQFKPMSGREDASGGIVFRFNDGKYYVARANALGNNFRLYYYDRGRRQLASASVHPPALAPWHTIRVAALGDHIHAWLDGTLSLDFATAPVFVINGLKREELIATNSMILHELYVDGLDADGEPDRPLNEALVRDFGSVERWRAEFVAMGKAMGGGSGWVLLTYSHRDRRLVNQWAADHTHSMAGGTPILALDMYEHSYHIDYGAAAAKYVDAFMDNISWANAGRLHEAH